MGARERDARDAREGIAARYGWLKPLQDIAVKTRGWTLDVLNIVHGLGKAVFSNADVYAHESALKLLHPGNDHIRDKIRQRLQALRDLGLLVHLGNGRWGVK